MRWVVGCQSHKIWLELGNTSWEGVSESGLADLAHVLWHMSFGIKHGRVCFADDSGIAFRVGERVK